MTISQLVETVKQKKLLKLLESFFEEEEFMAIFKEAPASTRYHGNYEGGLEKHTIGVARLCEAAVAHGEHYGGGINRDLLIAGALLHDIGKIDCYEKAKGDGPFKGYLTTQEGRMFGHIIRSALMVRDRALRTNLPDEIENELLHMILSHHGPVENCWGSAIDPITKEAVTLHYADLMESRVAGILEGRGGV